MPHNLRNGFTLVELMITIVVIGIIAAIALPSFKSTIENRKLIAAANALQADLVFARSAAIKRNRAIFVSVVNEGAANWCYGINELAACDCTVPGDCQVETQENIKNNTLLSAVTLQNASVNDVSFNQFRGFASTTATYLFTLGGKSTGVVLPLSGNARACSDSGLGGMASC